jgi:CheY-like chemotaxis protein
MLRRLLPESIDVRVIADDAGSCALADRGAMEQILVNLATNARDAMPEGGVLRIVTERVTIDEEFRSTHGFGTPGDYLRVSVSDTGVGMDKATRAKVFEPFFTTKPAGQGTGLGLAMVYGLVKQHGGFINLYSEVSTGTTVRVYLPVTQETENTVVYGPTEKLKGGTETILVVEDEESIRRSTRRVLEKYGYRVITAGDGKQGLELLRARGSEIDLVIADLVMPRLSGGALYRRVSEIPGSPKFIIASGYGGRESGERPDPAVPYLPKPWTVAELVRLVRQVLDGRHGSPMS